ncbi:hypothetical protein C7C45_09840 [Micromonospora arborensis]|uniref:Uncharacterized protein n=1 Tax=Micromonospora arborensis TaxID=2116518 RepID=A0A318NKY0_9ACTN|nr:hypothetical protein [Micromonospora arborensis]PYC71929.1 hypothetical protein C7C45_09840 [Micromonospora arborensis]
MNTVAQFVVGTVVAPAAAIVVYLHGVWTGHLIDLRAVSEFCPAKPLASTSTSVDVLPLRHLCHYADGTTNDLVPAYVNPIVFLCLALGVTCTALAVRSARRQARQVSRLSGRSR